MVPPPVEWFPHFLAIPAAVQVAAEPLLQLADLTRFLTKAPGAPVDSGAVQHEVSVVVGLPHAGCKKILKILLGDLGGPLFS